MEDVNDQQIWRVSEVYEPPQRLTMTQMSSDDQPREKLKEQGAAALSTAELIAILLRSGTKKESVLDLSRRLLHNCGNSLRTLGQMSVNELSQYEGIADVKAVTILAACELGKRRQQEEIRERLNVTSADDVFKLMHPIMQDLAEEEAYILLLNQSMKLIQDPLRISHGGLTETSVDVRIVGRQAIMANATAMILCHNHPSGSTRPSKNDDMITMAVKEAMRTLRIQMLDHIIIGDRGYYSYREEGKM